MTEKLITYKLKNTENGHFCWCPIVGSRAIVMECQYGPRRKGAQIKRHGEQLVKAEFKQTCPAR